MSENLHAPLITNFVQLKFHLEVQIITLLKGTIKLQQTDLGPHVCLGEHSQCSEGLINIVRCFLGVDDLVVEYCRDLQIHVVLGDRMLIRDVVYLLLHAVSVGD